MDITQKLIESEGLTEIKDGETFDLVQLTRSRETVTVHSGGICLDATPQQRNDEPWCVVFSWLLTAVGDTEFEKDKQHVHKGSSVFSTNSVLFAYLELGLTSKLTHVFVSDASYAPVDD